MTTPHRISIVSVCFPLPVVFIPSALVDADGLPARTRGGKSLVIASPKLDAKVP